MADAEQALAAQTSACTAAQAAAAESARATQLADDACGAARRDCEAATKTLALAEADAREAREDADAARGMGKILAAQTVLALAAFGATRLVQWRRSLHSLLEPSSLEEPIYGGKRRRGRRKKEAQVEGGGSF